MVNSVNIRGYHSDSLIGMQVALMRLPDLKERKINVMVFNFHKVENSDQMTEKNHTKKLHETFECFGCSNKHILHLHADT